MNKFGVLGKSIRSLDKHLEQINTLPKQIEDLSKRIDEIKNANNIITRAVRELIRIDLYKSFKENRDVGAWTDEEFKVQISLHDLYQSLGGNGEESVWWDKKKNWDIVTQEEYEKLYLKMIEKS